MTQHPDQSNPHGTPFGRPASGHPTWGAPPPPPPVPPAYEPAPLPTEPWPQASTQSWWQGAAPTGEVQPPHPLASGQPVPPPPVPPVPPQPGQAQQPGQAGWPEPAAGPGWSQPPPAPQPQPMPPEAEAEPGPPPPSGWRAEYAAATPAAAVPEAPAAVSPPTPAMAARPGSEPQRPQPPQPQPTQSQAQPTLPHPVPPAAQPPEPTGSGSTTPPPSGWRAEHAAATPTMTARPGSPSQPSAAGPSLPWAPQGPPPAPQGPDGARPPLAVAGDLPPTPPALRRGRRRWLVAAVAGVVVLALAAVLGVRWWVGRTPSATPTVYATDIPSGRGGPVQPGQRISIPPVPVPQDHDDETDDSVPRSPDRLDVPIPDVKPKGFVDPPEGSGLDRYVNQHVVWNECTYGDMDVECTDVKVPLDYADPDKQAITLSLLRIPATEPKVGSLFVNPGGPGGSGLGLAAGLDRTGLEMYDIVGWDPRGVGQSTPVQCANGADRDAMTAMDSSPDTPEELEALKESWKQFGLGCLERSGALLQHVSTQETVADLDLLRQLVGDKQLNFLGYSYGTEIGARYAEQYPQHVGRMVLDAAVNITGDWSVVQSDGFDTALRNYAQWCAERWCLLGGATADENIAVVTGLFDTLDATPLKVGDRELTQSLAIDGVARLLYSDESAYPTLTSLIQAARKGDGKPLLQSADWSNGRRDDGTYGQGFFALMAVSCLDSADAGLEASIKGWEEGRQRSVFGKYFGPSLGCEQWPVKDRSTDVTIDGEGAKPIVVIGSTGDSATPYPYAVWMARQLTSGVLVTFDGAGHGTFDGGRSSCVDEAVVRYLAEDVVPPYGLMCRS